MSVKRKESVTIHEIAAQLAVSASTVSRALNNNPRISRETRERVWKLARERGYQPYAPDFARLNAPSRAIGLVVTNLNNILYTETYRIMQEEALRNGYHVVLFNTQHRVDIERQIIAAANELGLCGIALSIAETTSEYSHIYNLIGSGLPIVGINRVNFDIPIPRVIIDYFQGAFSATTHLFAMGCQRIALLIGSKGCQIYAEILKGYRQAVSRAGFAYKAELVISSTLTEPDVDAAIDMLFHLESPPDAIIAANPTIALQITNRLAEAGIKIPEKVALVAFGNMPVLKWWSPSITCIETDALEFARVATSKFFDTLHRVEAGKAITVDTQIIPTRLTIRGSSVRR